MEFLLQNSTDTTIYMITGYVFIFSTMLIYLVSLFIRQRNLVRDLRALQQMKEHVD